MEGLLHERFVCMLDSSELKIILFGRLVLLSLHFFSVPTALGTALDINLSNASLVFISVTFATMVSTYPQKCFIILAINQVPLSSFG